MQNDHLHPIFKDIFDKQQAMNNLQEALRLKRERERLDKEIKIMENVRLVRRAEFIANKINKDLEGLT